MQRYGDLQLQASSFPIDSINHACLRCISVKYIESLTSERRSFSRLQFVSILSKAKKIFYCSEKLVPPHTMTTQKRPLYTAFVLVQGYRKKGKMHYEDSCFMLTPLDRDPLLGGGSGQRLLKASAMVSTLLLATTLARLKVCFNHFPETFKWRPRVVASATIINHHIYPFFLP